MTLKSSAKFAGEHIDIGYDLRLKCVAGVLLEVLVDEGCVEGGLKICDVRLLQHVELCNVVSVSNFDWYIVPVRASDAPVVDGRFCTDQLLGGHGIMLSASVVLPCGDLVGRAADIHAFMQA